MMFVSPAEIVRQMLIDAGLVVMPGIYGGTVPYVQIPGDGSTVCFTSSMPDEVDQAVCVFNTTGMTFGRILPTGRTLTHDGIKILVRALDETGYTLANSIQTWMDEVKIQTVVLNGANQYVQSLYSISPIISMGEEKDRKRQLWSINARLAMQDREPSLG